ncbi:MAG TPA: hypothetical protein ENN80_00210, partial [Candidatus Hydrogenedentes bacterium]|nr:hypothetical protein [Candidatus Hydrogenedentota bacterium]
MNAVRLDFVGGYPVWALLLGSVLALGGVVWAYRRDCERLPKRQRLLLTILRAALILLLICCLADPVLNYSATKREDMPVAVVIDVSQSMSVRDTPGRSSRLDSALEPCLGTPGVFHRLGRRFFVRYFTFDAGLRELEDPRHIGELEPTGEMTLMADALRATADLCAGQSLAGVLLLSDGADQSTLDAAAEARALGAPIFVIAAGQVATSIAQNPDVAVADVAGDRFMTVGVQHELAVRIEQHGYEGRAVALELRLEGETLDAKKVALDGAAQEVMLEFGLDTPGKHVLEVVTEPFEDEEITQNNRREFTCIMTKGTARVLYIEGAPRWEYKFIKRVIERDPGFSFTGFVRSNPDLLIRQGESIGAGAIPFTQDEFHLFDLVILGDVPPDGLSTNQLRAIRDAVLEHGTGFLLIPGARSNDARGFGDTPLADILPVWPDPEAEPIAGEFHMRLTPDGVDHPLFAGIDLEGAPPLQ